MMAASEALPVGDAYKEVDWDDFKPGRDRICYNLFRLETDEEIILLGTDVFTSLKGDITPRSICQLLYLAYHLKDIDGHFVFGEIPNELFDICLAQEFDGIDDSVLRKTTPPAVFQITIEDDEEANFFIATCFSYVAASYLRLYTKSIENYARVGDHIRNKFVTFYGGVPFPFKNLHLDIDAIRLIRSQFDANQVLRNTLYNLIYAGENCEFGKNLKDFLYVMHLSYTGLHCYDLYLRCMEAQQLSNADLANALDHTRCFTRELTLINHIFARLYGTRAEANMRCQMWRFARIFDTTFLSSLLSKHCPMFVATLAYLCKTCALKDKSHGVLSIAQIKEMPEKDKEIAKAIAYEAYVIIKKQQLGEPFSFLAEILYGRGQGVPLK